MSFDRCTVADDFGGMWGVAWCVDHRMAEGAALGAQLDDYVSLETGTVFSLR